MTNALYNTMTPEQIEAYRKKCREYQRKRRKDAQIRRAHNQYNKEYRNSPEGKIMQKIYRDRYNDRQRERNKCGLSQKT